MVCSHQFEDALVSQFVSEEHDGVLRAAAGCAPHGQGQGVRPGTKPQHAGAVGPHAPHARNGAHYRTWGTDVEEERSKSTTTGRIKITGSEVNHQKLSDASLDVMCSRCYVVCITCFVSIDEFSGSCTTLSLHLEMLSNTYHTLNTF